MTQYCRYCAFCIEGDAVFCTLHEELLSDKKARMVNHCKDFALSELGDVFTGRQYVPRKGKPLKAYDGSEQLDLFAMPPVQEGEDVEELLDQVRMFEEYVKEKKK